MTKESFIKFRLYFTAIITMAIWSLLQWNHYHDGVPSHHLLNREDLPAVSNWWGGITIPFLTWFLLYRIQSGKSNSTEPTVIPNNVLYAFIAALFFGILLSVTFSFGLADIPFYMMIGLLILALFFPIYRAECFLGFVLGMVYTFGGVLPIGVASVLAILGAVLYLLARSGVRFVTSRFTKR